MEIHNMRIDLLSLALLFLAIVLIVIALIGVILRDSTPLAVIPPAILGMVAICKLEKK